jgi:hypothetical protein
MDNPQDGKNQKIVIIDASQLKEHEYQDPAKVL